MVEFFYYAIITYCLKACSTVEDFTKYVYYEPLHLEECLEMTGNMIQETRNLNPRTRNRPINALCVKVEKLSDDRKSTYTIWGEAT